MKQLILTLCLAVLGGVTYAQPQLDKEEASKLRQETKAFFDGLDLDQEQRKLVADINKNFEIAAKDLRKKGESDFQAMRELRSLSKERDQELAGVLTKEQYKLYEKHLEERRQRTRALLKRPDPN